MIDYLHEHCLLPTIAARIAPDEVQEAHNIANGGNHRDYAHAPETVPLHCFLIAIVGVGETGPRYALAVAVSIAFSSGNAISRTWAGGLTDLSVVSQAIARVEVTESIVTSPITLTITYEASVAALTALLIALVVLEPRAVGAIPLTLLVIALAVASSVVDQVV